MTPWDIVGWVVVGLLIICVGVPMLLIMGAGFLVGCEIVWETTVSYLRDKKESK